MDSHFPKFPLVYLEDNLRQLKFLLENTKVNFKMTVAPQLEEKLETSELDGLSSSVCKLNKWEMSNNVFNKFVVFLMCQKLGKAWSK